MWSLRNIRVAIVFSLFVCVELTAQWIQAPGSAGKDLFALTGDGANFFAGGIDSLYRSTDFGMSWHGVESDLPSNSIIVSSTGELPLAPPGESNLIRGNENGNIVQLEQNYPNPFNPMTTIRYLLAINTYATLKVYNSLGIEVATLVDGIQDTGYKVRQWDASNLPGGVYTYRITAGMYSEFRKTLLLK